MIPLQNLKNKTASRKQHIWQGKLSRLSWLHIFGSWIIISSFVIVGLYFNLDKFVVGSVALVATIISQALSGVILLLGTVPILGPALAKVLSIPLIWFINGVGYLASLIAIKRGYSKDVITYRSLTIALLIGITIGYILGKYL